jgi:peptidoglycan/LPS O-acetylase OafA/YrhL
MTFDADPKEPAGAPPLAELTSLRWFAALWVVLYHFRSSFPMDPGGDHLLAGTLQSIVEAGYLGVSFFFVLSGFVLVYRYDPARRPVPARPFWAARAARLYPLYLAAFLVAMPLTLNLQLSRDSLGVAVAKELAYSAAALPLVHSWIPQLVGRGNFPSWSLCVEAFFYLLFPLVMPLVLGQRSRRALVGIALTAFALACLPPLAWMALAHPSAEWFFFGDHGARMPVTAGLVFVKLAPPMHLGQFLLGALAGHVFLSRPRSGPRPLLVLGSSLAVLLAVLGSSRFPYPMLHDGLFAPLFAVVIYSFACGSTRRPLLARSTFVLLGEGSYALYLLHIPVAGYLLALPIFQPELFGWIRGTGTAAFSPSGLAFFLAVVHGLSLASFLHFEQRARAWVRRRLVRWAAPPPVAPQGAGLGSGA